jgi:predicted HAD superfamily Cof-like phosphohydrolase
MSKDWVNDIVEFHKEINQPYIINPSICNNTMKDLRENLISEEIIETINAIEEKDLAKIADGIVDSIVVLIGTALAYGIDIRPIWDEVHRTNMAKTINKTFRKDGKLLKPVGWMPPEILPILEAQQEEYLRKE